MKKVLVLALLALSATTFGQDSFIEKYKNQNIFIGGELKKTLESYYTIHFAYKEHNQSELRLINQFGVETSLYKQVNEIAFLPTIKNAFTFDAIDENGNLVVVIISSKVVNIREESGLSVIYNNPRPAGSSIL
jgi:hypothetical protein